MPVCAAYGDPAPPTVWTLSQGTAEWAAVPEHPAPARGLWLGLGAVAGIQGGRGEQVVRTGAKIMFLLCISKTIHVYRRRL